MKLAVDASNLRGGGGITHLVELLSHADPHRSGVSNVTVWAGRQGAARLPRRPWLDVMTPPILDRSLAARTWWQVNQLGPWCRAHADVLFVPGGLYAGSYRPYVTMCRNMLPFDLASARLYGYSRTGLRLRMLRPLQARSFRAAAGVVFLTDHAKQHVETLAGPLPSATVIPHGVSAAFRNPPRKQEPIGSFSDRAPFRWLYVSIVDVYKHQVEVAHAVAQLRREGLPVSIDFVGPTYTPAFRRLQRAMRELDPDSAYIRHVPPVQHSELSELYRRADAFVFASSCENLPNILLEAMAAGLPIACSRRAPMPQILGDGGEYFEPTDAASIAAAMQRVMANAQLRTRLANAAFDRATSYSWETCARDTFDFLVAAANAPN